MRFITAIVLVGLSLGEQAFALEPGDRIDNFRLLDQRGASHELYYLSDMPVIVLGAQQNGCPASREAALRLRELNDAFATKGVAVRMLNSTLLTTRESVAAEMSQSAPDVPVLLDPTQLVGETLGAKRAGEVFVIDTKDWTLTYRGPVAHVEEAVQAALAGNKLKRGKVRVRGCEVRMPEYKRERAHAKISYERTIAPMLQEKCATCHREGGIAPWAMSSYEMVKGFAPMIREVVRTERMPPWHADPQFGAFSNDRSLTAEQKTTLVHWIEAGALKDKKSRRSKGTDPLATRAHQPSTEWALGTPDLVVEIPDFEVPATGAIDYQRPVVKNTLGRDVWLRAVEFSPTHREVVHHILAGLSGKNVQGGAASITSLGVYVPGDVPHALPADTGVFIPKDADFTFQMHYTASGKVVTEKTRVALYFAAEPPKYPLRNTVLLDARLKIPANTKDHPAQVERTFPKDVLLYTLMAHSHVRGKSAQYSAIYPDGTREVLLSVPHYDFNWQTSYELETPKLLPKGTKLIYSSSYDNSTQNKANPDPTIEVHWGEQTWEEMIYGDVRYRYPDEINESAAVAESRAPSSFP
jgi:hypothetical protein